MARGLDLPKNFLDEVARTVDYRAPISNVSTQKWSFTGWAMSMVMKDRAGPQLIADVAPSARKRWAEQNYRPKALKRVAIDLDRRPCTTAEGPKREVEVT